MTGWAAASASVRGSMHVRRDRPNQDAVRTVAITGGVVAAVADGHGGDRYVRSDVGARVAVDVACDQASAWWARAGGLSTAGIVASIGSELAPAIVDAWRREILAHAAANPFTEEERARAGVDPAGDPAVSYGATALVAIASGDVVALAQLGDGDVTVVTADGGVLSPMAGDDRLVAGQTTSLCLPTAVADVRAAVVGPDQRPAIVLLSTDGYGNSFADPAWQATVASDLRRQLAAADLGTVEHQLPSWLADSAEVGGDDVTVALLVRSSTPGAAAPVPAAASVTGGGRGTAALAVAAIAGLLVGGIGGFVARGDGAARRPVAVATTTSAVPVPLTTEVPTLAEVNAGGPGGSLVGFVPDPDAPAPRLLTAASEGSERSWTTEVELGESTFAISDGVLRRDRVRLTLGDGFEAGALYVAGGLVWVIDSASARLVPVDPSTGEPAGAIFPIEAA